MPNPTVYKYHIVSDEYATPVGDGYGEHKKEDVEEEARRRGALVAVRSSCGFGWQETDRYDPAETVEEVTEA